MGMGGAMELTLIGPARQFSVGYSSFVIVWHSVGVGWWAG